MLALAIHTSSPDLGLALSNSQETARHQVWSLGRDLSSQLHLRLAEFLAPHSWSELSWLAVAIGPGGFTGTRIGVVTARILSQQLGIPLFGISSLAAAAASQLNQPGRLAVTLKAQRGELFGAVYERTETRCQQVVADALFSQQGWQQVLARYGCPVVALEGGLGITTPALLSLGLERWQRGERPSWTAVMPYYGQHPVVL